ncbi:MAG: hypothetical protein GOV15_00540, partial [Candidatus Diapherotrites archaeon]|nr:hypothetical protein [Candidatus Diapherotrites archaeon]
GNLALRCNFATIAKFDDAVKVIDRRVARTLTSKQGKTLADLINKKVKLKSGVKFEFVPTREHRAVVVFRNDKFSNFISGNDPAYDEVVSEKGVFGTANPNNDDVLGKCEPLNESSEAKFSSEVVNDFIEQSLQVLAKASTNKTRVKNELLPANALLVRDAGIALPEFESVEKTTKLKWAAIVGMPLERGLAKAAGMNLLTYDYPENPSAESVRGQIKASLKVEIESTLRLMKKNWHKFDAFYVHFKPCDIAGHDGDFRLKKKLLERIDRDFITQGFPKVDLMSLKIVVTCDHSTPCELKAHSSDPVPLLIFDGKNKDKVPLFGERACSKGSLGTLKGIDVMSLAAKPAFIE